MLVLILVSATTLTQATAAPYPLAATVAAVRRELDRTTIAPTGVTRDDYLSLAAGIVDAFRPFQTAEGRILDPVLHREVQYATPCYARAAAALVVSGKRPDLRDSAERALGASLRSLAEGRAADDHGDFFMLPSVLAYEELREMASAERRAQWKKWLGEVRPARSYQFVLDKRPDIHNWNVIALAGEYLRNRAGFTDLEFVERHLAVQLGRMTAEGLYVDPGAPMAYDLFPRHALAIMLERGYDGPSNAVLDDLMDRGAWTSLLIQSPAGEWPIGGRSAQHQWNEAMQAVTFEIWARRRSRAGDMTGARAFKRAAHLALVSLRRWTRPSGDLWIVKNRFDPSVRHGFERYSFHSQYNLLAASMLATAWRFADDGISEGASPADAGGFVVELPRFHKIVANAGGLYLEIDTNADAHYNSTGLVRIHKSGVDPLVGPSDTGAIDDGPPATGVAWREDGQWKELAALTGPAVSRVTVTTEKVTSARVEFAVRYELAGSAVQVVIEKYELSPTRVRVEAEVVGRVTEILVRFPAFVFDGERTADVTIGGSSATVRLGDSRQTFEVESPHGVRLSRSDRAAWSRNGCLVPIEAIVAGRRVTYTLTPRAGRAEALHHDRNKSVEQFSSGFSKTATEDGKAAGRWRGRAKE